MNILVVLCCFKRKHLYWLCHILCYLMTDAILIMIWPLLCLGKRHVFGQGAVAKPNFCCGKLKENTTKTAQQKWLDETMFDGPQREGAAMFLACEASPTECSSTERIAFLSAAKGLLSLRRAGRRTGACCTSMALGTFLCLLVKFTEVSQQRMALTGKHWYRGQGDSLFLAF